MAVRGRGRWCWSAHGVWTQRFWNPGIVRGFASFTRLSSNFDAQSAENSWGNKRGRNNNKMEASIPVDVIRTDLTSFLGTRDLAALRLVLHDRHVVEHRWVRQKLQHLLYRPRDEKKPVVACVTAECGSSQVRVLNLRKRQLWCSPYCLRCHRIYCVPVYHFMLLS